LQPEIESNESRVIKKLLESSLLTKNVDINVVWTYLVAANRKTTKLMH